MNYCSKRHKYYLFGLVKWGFQPHSFLITNAFYTLEDANVVELVRTCQYCDFKDVLSLDRQTVFELVERYPNAFSSVLRSFIKVWMS